MNALPSSAAASAAVPLVPADPAAAILAAARLLLPRLERGERVDTAILRNAMEAAFGASDASGAWDWKAAYEAGEAAAVLLLRKYGRVLFRTVPSPAARLSLLGVGTQNGPRYTLRFCRAFDGAHLAKRSERGGWRIGIGPEVIAGEIDMLPTER